MASKAKNSQSSQFEDEDFPNPSINCCCHWCFPSSRRANYRRIGPFAKLENRKCEYDDGGSGDDDNGRTAGKAMRYFGVDLDVKEAATGRFWVVRTAWYLRVSALINYALYASGNTAYIMMTMMEGQRLARFFEWPNRLVMDVAA